MEKKVPCSHYMCARLYYNFGNRWLRNIQTPTFLFTELHGPRLHEGASRTDNLFESVSVNVAVFNINTLVNMDKWSTSDGLIDDLSNLESSNITHQQMFVRNRIKTGSISLTNCKRLINKIFPHFHTVLNSIISCILSVNYYDIFLRFSILDLNIALHVAFNIELIELPSWTDMFYFFLENVNAFILHFSRL